MRNSLIHISRLIGTASQVSSRSRLHLVNRALYSISHHEQNNSSHEEGVHFENTRPEDALPFSTDSKGGLAFKMILFFAVAMGLPIVSVYYQKNANVKTFSKESSQPWIEKYRPKNMNDIYSQNEIVSALIGDIISGNLPHLLFYGPPGTGKTSAILALCRDMFGDNFRDRVLELNASDERGIAVVREKVKDFAKTLVSFKNQVPPFKMIILDEADSMTFDAQAALRRIMETYSTTTRFCIICNYVYRIIDPLASRCAKFRFKPISPQDSKNRLMSICKQENLSCDPEALDILIQKTGGDLRKSINYLQSAYRIVQFDKKYVTVSMVSDLLGIISNNVIDSLFENIQHSSLDKLHEFILNNIIQEGYSLTQLLYQLQESLVQSGLFSSSYKSLISVKMAHVLKNLMDGADGYLQILDLVSFMYQYTFNKTKGKSKVDLMNIISSA